MTQQSQRPDTEFRAGTISAAIWKKAEFRDGRSVTQHSIRIQKRYKDERTGEWKTTTFFRPDDMPKLVLVANEVYKHTTLREFAESSTAPVPQD